MSAERRFPAVIFSAVFLCSVLSSCADENASSQSFVFDTYASITVSGNGAENVLSEINADFSEISAAFDICYDTDAKSLPENAAYTDCFEKTALLRDIYGKRVNICCGALTDIWKISTDSPRVPSDEEIAEALTKISCDKYGDFPEGMKLDFGAVSKGYACDRAYRTLSNSDVKYSVVSLSSSALFFGEKTDGGLFRAGIKDPLGDSGYVGTLSLPASFVSTSGGYERFFEADGKKYSHILDTDTGRPCETDIASVTVILPADTPDGGITSDFLATLIYTEGADELPKWLSRGEFETVAVLENGAVYSSCKGFELSRDGGYYYGR